MILKFITGIAWVWSVIAIVGIYIFFKAGDGKEMGFWILTGSLAWAWLIGYYLV